MKYKKYKIWLKINSTIFILGLLGMIVLTSLNLSGISIPKQTLFQVSMIPIYMIGGFVGLMSSLWISDKATIKSECNPKKES